MLNFTNLLSAVANSIGNFSAMSIPSIDRSYLIDRNFIVPTIIPVEEKEEIDGSFQLSTISAKLRDKIISITNDIHLRNILVNRALETYSLLAFAVTYMTDPNVKLRNEFEDEDKALINSVGMLAGFGKIYSDNKVANIDLSDVDNMNSSIIGTYILKKDELVDFLLSEQFQKAMKRRNYEVFVINSKNQQQKDESKQIEDCIDVIDFVEVKEDSNNTKTVESKKPETSNTVNPCPNPAFEMLNNENYAASNPAYAMFGQREELVKPRFTVVDDNPIYSSSSEPIVSTPQVESAPEPQIIQNNNEYIIEDKTINNITYSSNMDLGTVHQFERVLEKWLPANIKRRYNYKLGFYYLYITNNDGTESRYILDDGSIMGGRRISVLGSFIKNINQVNNVFVDIEKHPLITTKLFKDPLYLMSIEEVNECWYDHLYNKAIYNAIDFHNTEFFDKMSEEEKYNFELTLLGILKIDMFANIRFRFKEFVDSTHYTLVSDYQMFRPLPCIQSIQMPETYVADGLEIKVDGPMIHAMFNGSFKSFRMETM